MGFSRNFSFFFYGVFMGKMIIVTIDQDSPSMENIVDIFQCSSILGPWSNNFWFFSWGFFAGVHDRQDWSRGFLVWVFLRMENRLESNFVYGLNVLTSPWGLYGVGYQHGNLYGSLCRDGDEFIHGDICVELNGKIGQSDRIGKVVSINLSHQCVLQYQREREREREVR